VGGKKSNISIELSYSRPFQPPATTTLNYFQGSIISSCFDFYSSSFPDDLILLAIFNVLIASSEFS